MTQKNSAIITFKTLKLMMIMITEILQMFSAIINERSYKIVKKSKHIFALYLGVCFGQFLLSIVWSENDLFDEINIFLLSLNCINWF